MAELSIGGEAFHVEIDGDEDAPVLMLSNALGTNLHMWDPQVLDLVKHYRVLRYDSRGHGASVVSEGPYSIADLGKDALAILDALGFEKVDFLGLSLGGIIGQWLLTHAPKRIGKAILANTASQLPPADSWNSRIQTVLQSGMEPVVAGTIEHWFTRDFRESNPQQIARIEDMLLKTPPQGYAATCAALRDVDLREAVRSVTAPVLVLVGRHDPITPPGIGALLMSSMQKAKLVTLDASHLSNVESPEHFTEKVLEFLLAEESIHEPVAAVSKAPRKPRVKKPKAPEAARPLEIIEAPVAVRAPAETATSEKPTSKKAAPSKTPAAKAAPATKAPATQAPATQATAKKTVEKKTVEKKTAGKKAAAKKASANKTPAKKAPVKKAAAKKVAVKKAAPKKALKNTTPKKEAKKASLKKAAVKKSATKKTIKKTAVTKGAKKSADKKMLAKTTPVKKMAVKKVPAKSSASKKSPAKKAKKR
jgi:3-oxoadipate enol-lactonase